MSFDDFDNEDKVFDIYIEDLAKDFIAESKDDFLLVEEHIAANRYDQARATIHKIKGGALVFKQQDIVEKCQKFDEILKVAPASP